jgi:hypothetical protein
MTRSHKPETKQWLRKTSDLFRNKGMLLQHLETFICINKFLLRISLMQTLPSYRDRSSPTQYNKNKLRGLSPRANYTDWATAARQRSYCQLLQIEGVAWSGRMIPTGRILSFPDRSRHFFFQIAPQLYSQGWVDSVPDPLLLRKSGSAGNRSQELRICSQELWPLDHRGGIKSKSKSHCGWRSASQYVLVSSPIWDFWPEIFFFLQSYCLVFLGRPLWREVGSVICQSLSLQSTIVSQHIHTSFTLNIYIIYVRHSSVIYK